VTGFQDAQLGSSSSKRSGLPSFSRSQHRVWKRQPTAARPARDVSLSTRRFLAVARVRFRDRRESATV